MSEPHRGPVCSPSRCCSCNLQLQVDTRNSKPVPPWRQAALQLCGATLGNEVALRSMHSCNGMYRHDHDHTKAIDAMPFRCFHVPCVRVLARTTIASRPRTWCTTRARWRRVRTQVRITTSSREEAHYPRVDQQTDAASYACARARHISLTAAGPRTASRSALAPRSVGLSDTVTSRSRLVRLP